MAFTVDTIESVLIARTGQYIKDMKAAENAFDSWMRKVNSGGADAGTAKAEASATRRTRARTREVESEVAAAARIASVVDRSIAKRDQEAAAAERAADRIAKAGSRRLAAEQSRLMSGTSLSASPGQGPVSAINYALRDQIDLRNKLTAATITGDQAAINGLQDQLRYLQQYTAFRRQGLTEIQAAIRAEDNLKEVVQARAAAETRAGISSDRSARQQANGYRNLGRQFADIGVGLSSGQGPFIILAQQLPQVADALTDVGAKSGFAGKAIKTLQFFATPVGAILLAAASAALIFGSKLFESTKNVNDSVDALKKEAKEAEINRQAKERFKTTLEGVTEAVKDNKKALDDLADSQKTAAERANIDAQTNLKNAIDIRKRTRDELNKAQNDIAGASPLQAGAQAAAVSRRNRIAKELADAEKAVAAAESALRQSRAELGVERSNRRADALATPEGGVQANYDREKSRLEAAAKANISQAKSLEQVQKITTQLTNDIAKLTKARDADLKKIQEVNNKPPSGNYVSLLSPVAGGRVTSGIGQRSAPIAGASTNHAGTDIAGLPVGTPVRAGANGVVISAGRLGALGNAVIVDYGAGTIAKYGHLDSVLTSRGQRVSAGEQIGTLGNTGRTTGAHLHYEVRTNGKVVNPNGRVRVGDQTAAEGRDLAQEQREAEQAAKEALENERRYQDEIAAINARIAGFKAEQARTIEEETVYAQAAVERAKIDRDEDYARQLTDGKINQAKYDNLILLNGVVADAEKEKIQRDSAVKIGERDLEIAKQVSSLRIDALSAEAELVTTRTERYELEKRILEHTQREERAAAVRAGASDEAMGLLGRRQGAERRSLDKRFESPLERYRSEVGEVGSSINDSLEQVQVDGLQALNSELTDAITGAKSLGDAFKNVANQIIADLVRIAVQQAIIKPLLNLIPGGSGLGSIFSGLFGGGRAGGGNVSPGRFYKTNEYGTEGYASFKDPGRIIPLGEMNAKQGGNTTIVQQTFTLDARGGITTPQLLEYVNTTARTAATQAGVSAYNGAVKAAPGATATARRFGNG